MNTIRKLRPRANHAYHRANEAETLKNNLSVR